MKAQTVYTALSSRADGDGLCAVKYQEVADELGVSRRTVIRLVKKLVTKGLVAVEHRYRDNRQLTNLFRLTGTKNVTPSTYISTEKKELLEENQVVDPGSVVVPHLHLPTHRPDRNPDRSPLIQGGSLRLPKVDVVGLGRSPVRHTAAITPESAPVSKANKKPGPLSPEIGALIEFFGVHVEKTARQRITDDRRRKWYLGAIGLLVTRRRPIDEVQAAIHWVWAEHDGHLPFRDKWNGYNAKVTNLGQIADNYDQIMEHMRIGFQHIPSDPAPPHPDYGEPFADQELEAHVTTLVEHFGAFHRAMGERVNEWRQWGWAKTFRVMLFADGRSFTDIDLVITNLKACGEWIDLSRYDDVYYLRAEFDHVAKVVGLVLEDEQPESTAVPSRRLPFDGENVPRIRRDDEAASSNMAENAEERHRRYLARCARRSDTAS